MNYAAMALGTAVLPAYAYGRWTNYKAIENFDEVKRLQKLVAARRAGEQEAVQKAAAEKEAAAAQTGGKKDAGHKETAGEKGKTAGAEHDSSLGGSLNGRSIDDDVGESGSLERRDNNDNAGGSSRGGEDDGRLLLLTKYEQVTKEKARPKIEQQQVRDQFHKAFGAHPFGDKATMDSLNFNNIAKESTKDAEKAVEAVVPKHPRLDKSFA